MEGGWAVNPASAMAKKVRFLPPAPINITVDAEVGSSPGLENQSNLYGLIVRCYHLPPILNVGVAQW